MPLDAWRRIAPMRSMLLPNSPKLNKLPALDTVIEPISVPMLPTEEPLPETLNTSELAAAPAVPLRLPTVSVLASPVPRRSVVPSASTALPRLIAPPEMEARVTSAVIAAAPLPPRLSAPEVTVNMPARFLAEAAVALRPPAKAKTALAWLPRVIVPVLASVVLPANILDRPVKDRL